MRTTVTLDPDSRLLIERLMRERGLSFKQAINEAIRRGLAGEAESRDYTIPRRMGAPRVDLTKALQISTRTEDEARAHRLREGR